jgi:hypothetical protein
MSKQKSITFINHLYKDLTYTSAYSPFILLNILLIIGLYLYIVYINILKNINYYKDNWDTEKCKPSVIPFAGIINKPKNQTAFQFTGENFEYCVQSIIKDFAGASLDPFYFITSILTELYSSINEIVNLIRDVISYIRNSISDIIETFLGKIVNVTSSVKIFLANVRDIMNRTLGSVVLLYYFIQGLFSSLFSSLGAFTQAMFYLLIILTAFIFVLIIGLQIIPAALFGTAYALIAIPLVYLIYLMSTALPQSSGLCFDKNTIFKLSNDSEITISNLKVGDVLKDGTIINCHFTLDASNETMYNLNGVIVSGSHPVLYNNQWISVSKHPEVEKVLNYFEKYIYCLNTSNKKIIINNITFSDWDDVFSENKYQILLNNINNKDLNNIHKYYDKGCHKSTLVKMFNGLFKPISEIKVGEILDNYIKVCGIVHIKSDDLINGNLLNDCEKDLGNFYNLLTNTGYFYINNLKYSDFNSCIDRYLNVF